jgi:hypothetical protein
MWKARLPAASCLVLTFVLAVDSRLRAEEAAERKGPKELAGLKYRLVGPPAEAAWRASSAFRRPLHYYAATASGGVWKSLDGGTQWKPCSTISR